MSRWELKGKDKEQCSTRIEPIERQHRSRDNYFRVARKLSGYVQ